MHQITHMDKYVSDAAAADTESNFGVWCIGAKRYVRRSHTQMSVGLKKLGVQLPDTALSSDARRKSCPRRGSV